MSRGVKGISLHKGDSVVGIEPIHSGIDSILSVCERGYGKRTLIEDYRLQSRGGYGIITIKTSKRNGYLVGSKLVREQDQIILVTNRGKILKMAVKEISKIGRNTQGVKLIRLEEDECVVSLECITKKKVGICCEKEVKHDSRN
jgi:DNA gyrase subunit A